jgi:hypothetical protein
VVAKLTPEEREKMGHYDPWAIASDVLSLNRTFSLKSCLVVRWRECV